MSAGRDRPLEDVLPRVHALVDRYRATCLWFLAEDYYPRSRDQVLQVLAYVQRYGDLEAFRSAGTLRQWLSPTSSDAARDTDVFHDTDAALVEGARDSAFRFFPLMEHAEFGLVLHPFDLATNKVLALAGRLEPRDWVDVIVSSERLQQLGYLAWAACGKDPGFSPLGILNAAGRTGRYSHDELAGLAFAGTPPDAADLGRRWHHALEEARRVIDALPPSEVGAAVLTTSGELFRGAHQEIAAAMAHNDLLFHPGRIKGAFPTVRPRN